MLLAVGAFVLIEGVRRLIEPPSVGSGAMVVFGVVGLIGNIASMLVLTRRRGVNFNMRAAFLEVVNDALGSVAVLIAAVVIATTGWLRADATGVDPHRPADPPAHPQAAAGDRRGPARSQPRGLDLAAVREHLLDLPHVHAVHDLHASQIASGLPVLTAHVVVDDSCFQDGHAPQMLDQLQACVAGHFPVAVQHSTCQLEPASHAHHEAATHA